MGQTTKPPEPWSPSHQLGLHRVMKRLTDVPAQSLAVAGAQESCCLIPVGPRGSSLGLGDPSKSKGTPLPPSTEAGPRLPRSCSHLSPPGQSLEGGSRHLSGLQNHVNLVHRKGKTKVCPHPGCGKKFYLSNHLRRHMIIHSGQARGGAGCGSGDTGLGLGGRAGARGETLALVSWHGTAPRISMPYTLAAVGRRQ